MGGYYWLLVSVTNDRIRKTTFAVWGSPSSTGYVVDEGEYTIIVGSRKNLRCFSKHLLASCTLFYLGVAAANLQAAVDIRAADKLNVLNQQTAYIAAIDDCTDVTTVNIYDGTGQRAVPVSEALRSADSPVGCYIPFTVSGAQQFNPTIIINYQNLDPYTYTETFIVEQTPPQLTFENVGLLDVAGQQHLVMNVTATDDTDISYLTYSVLGLRASALRAAGGVVDVAKQTQLQLS